MLFNDLMFTTAVQPFLAEASSASTGGDGVAFAIGGTALGAICTALVNIWRSRNQKTEIAPNPLAVEQTAQQALWKENAKDHANLFERLRKVEAEVAGHTAAILAMKEMQNRIYDMVSKLYEKVCVGGKKK